MTIRQLLLAAFTTLLSCLVCSLIVTVLYGGPGWAAAGFSMAVAAPQVYSILTRKDGISGPQP